jgi:hypothetical protein
VTVDRIVGRLLAEGHAMLDVWPTLVVLVLGVAGPVGLAVGLLSRKRLAGLTVRLEQADRRLGETKARLAQELKELEAERQVRRHLEAVVASLRAQLAAAQDELAGRRKPAEPAPRKSPQQARYDELFGDGPVIDGTLTKGELERLLEALQAIEDLVKSRFGPSRLAAADGPAWWRYVASKGIPHAIDVVTAYRKDLIEFANALEAIVIRQPELEFRLRRIVGDVGLVAGLLNTAAGYIRAMERLNDGASYKATVLEMALGQPFQLLVQAQASLHEWTRLFVERRAPAVRRAMAADP